MSKGISAALFTFDLDIAATNQDLISNALSQWIPLRRRASFSASPYNDPNDWMTTIPGRNILSTTSFNAIEAIRCYLPGLADAMIQWQCDADCAINQLVYNSDAVNTTRGRTRGLNEDYLAQVYTELVNSIIQSGAILDIIYQGLLAVLRQKLALDEKDARAGSWDPDANERTFGLFSAFGEISYQTRAHWLGRLMHEFFLDHAGYLVSDDDTTVNLEWATCIQNSGMTTKDKRECIRLLQSVDPDLRDALRRDLLRGGYGNSRLLYDSADEYRNNLRGRRARNLGSTSSMRSFGNRRGSPFDGRNRYRRPRSVLDLRRADRLDDQVQDVLEAANTLQVVSRELARVAGQV
ncbi:hypothetical protein LTR02_007136 [Friedmanniomyces endolithicus]|nr:hypothetical protein LTR94_000667 [Friedmanniomyces endolithicus]KAK0776083.1 hypothetical protein LTR38_015622 [Friedmanniomyces endolithicus]KAK0783989.1 hypothetical protein LTR75_013946 [Friedmanniomyces endolithicus]KAK0790344.1 hypothetical protein LTR59_009275 [Friedmanniomyces endolithicus]KAK0854840.1 hypothetical protein LTS02_011354 [Friedmanniomyces endolithicus]